MQAEIKNWKLSMSVVCIEHSLQWRSLSKLNSKDGVWELCIFPRSFALLLVNRKLLRLVYHQHNRWSHLHLQSKFRFLKNSDAVCFFHHKCSSLKVSRNFGWKSRRYQNFPRMADSFKFLFNNLYCGFHTYTKFLSQNRFVKLAR